MEEIPTQGGRVPQKPECYGKGKVLMHEDGNVSVYMQDDLSKCAYCGLRGPCIRKAILG